MTGHEVFHTVIHLDIHSQRAVLWITPDTRWE